MSKLTWESVPTISEQYYAAKHVFEKIEDICAEVLITKAQSHVWLKFISDYTWPGPKVQLRGAPLPIAPWYGLKEIPYGSIKIDIKNAFKRANTAMKKKELGDYFVGTIIMYWPLVETKEAEEPFYAFTTNTTKLLYVGAYTGKVTKEQEIAEEKTVAQEKKG